MLLTRLPLIFASATLPNTIAIMQTPNGPVVVQRSDSREGVILTAELPRAWSFSIKVDGDRDGTWGKGAVPPEDTGETSADIVFGERDGARGICTRYALSTTVDNPDRVYVSSQCGTLQSAASLRIKRVRKSRRRLTFHIPKSEIFGLDKAAHVQFCVWNTRYADCMFSPASPYVLTRSPSERRADPSV